MLPGVYDIYVLSNERSASALNHFLSHFAPDRKEAAEDFAVHDAAQGTEQIFDCLAPALDYCFAHPSAHASFYWQCPSSPEVAMASFTADGGLILGLGVSEAESSKALARLRKFVAGDAPGYISFEQPPPDTTAEFFARASRSKEEPSKFEAALNLGCLALMLFVCTASCFAILKTLTSLPIWASLIVSILTGGGMFLAAHRWSKR
jgi:hypothetical protein